jgi:hypothetical protein
MDSQDEVDVEKLRVDPALMQQVLDQQARKSKRKGWQRNYTLIPKEWELRLLEAKRISTYRLAHEILYLTGMARESRSPCLVRWRGP